MYAYQIPLIIDGSGLGFTYLYESERKYLAKPLIIQQPKEQVIKQFSRLNDTIFELKSVDFEQCNAFIPAKLLNAAKRNCTGLI